MRMLKAFCCVTFLVMAIYAGATSAIGLFVMDDIPSAFFWLGVCLLASANISILIFWPDK